VIGELRALAPDLWVVERPLGNPLAEVGTRMTVIRLDDGSLFLHSPVRLDRRIRASLDALGPVRHVVAPNRAHHLFASDYLAGYPDASLYAAPGLPQKRRDLNFAAELGDEAPYGWRGQIEQIAFRGIPLLNEVVFFHPPTRTLLLTDLAFNIPPGGLPGARLFGWISGADGHFGPHRLLRRFMVRDREAARASIARVLDWDFDRVTLTHGDVRERDGRDGLREGFAFLDR
jgi:hypothetical protein